LFILGSTCAISLILPVLAFLVDRRENRIS